MARRKPAKGNRAMAERLRERAQENREFSMMTPVYSFSEDVLTTTTTTKPDNDPDSDPDNDPDNDNSIEDYYFHRVVFRRGDDVLLNSEWEDTSDTWVGNISQIRYELTERGDRKVVAKVRWYWSRNDIKGGLLKSFDPRKCSPWERILSDDYDFIGSHAFQSVTHVQRYDERSLDPPKIGSGDFFYRSVLAPYKGKKTIRPPLGDGTCICGEAYSPYPEPSDFDVQSGEHYEDPTLWFRGRSRTMRFCVAPSCRRWYHTSCLDFGRHLDTRSSGEARPIRLLAADPDNEVCPSPLLSCFEHEIDLAQMEMLFDGKVTTLEDTLVPFGYPKNTFYHLPVALVSIAQCPIVRVAGTEHGWALGNVADVVTARRLVYTALAHRGAPELSEAYKTIKKRHWQRHNTLETIKALCSEEAEELRLSGSVDDGEIEEVGLAMHEGINCDMVDKSDADMLEGDDTELDWCAKDVKGKGRERLFTPEALLDLPILPDGTELKDETHVMELLCEDLIEFDGVLAMPNNKYWEDRAEEYATPKIETFLTGPQYICPRCKRAI